MVDPIGHAKGPPEGHLRVPVDKGVEKLTGLLTSLQGLSGVANLPPAVQAVLDKATTLSGLLTGDLTGKAHIIPTLHKAMATLAPLVHQTEKELEETGTIDFTKGPYSTAWTNSLLDKATLHLDELIQLLQA